ncbi:zinc finger protein 524-like [Mauremys mutica]|uniref:zinc finger protein 524-like n=1 Tax=Mauremys mutica TaxID=74926 RepID=UPI001D16A539|nr:zinc finger protein 524-like [Mauremys mutica]
MEPAQRREWDGVQGGSPPSKTAEGGEGHPGSHAWQDLEVTGIWPASARYAQPTPKWGEAPARGRRPEGPGVSRAQPEPPKPGLRATWGPKLHSALTGWPRGGDPPRAPPPKPRGPYRSRLAGPGWLLPPEAPGAGIPPSSPAGQPEDNLLLIDAQGVPYTVSRRDLEAGPAPAPRRAHCCPVCRRAFLYLSDLERHRISHSEHKPHLCRACGKAFKRASHLQRHRHIHTGERPFRCAVCQKGFRESGELLRHQRVHTGEKPYQCPLCRLRFTERNTLRRHAKRKHAREACYQGAGPGAWADGGEGRPGWAGEGSQEVGSP